MKHMMLDLETLGVNSGCPAIWEIGACTFDTGQVGAIGECFSIRVDAQSCIDLGMKVEWSTIQWLVQQSDTVRNNAAAPSWSKSSYRTE